MHRPFRGAMWQMNPLESMPHASSQSVHLLHGVHAMFRGCFGRACLLAGSIDSFARRQIAAQDADTAGLYVAEPLLLHPGTCTLGLGLFGRVNRRGGISAPLPTGFARVQGGVGD